MNTITLKDGTSDLLQGLGQGTADRVFARLAAERGRLGRPDAVLRAAWLSRHRARPARPWPLRLRRGTAMTWTPTRTISPRLFEKLDLKDAIMVGHSTGGGEVARYLGRHGTKRVAKAALISAVPPLMLKTEKNPRGRPSKSSTVSGRRSRPTGRSSTRTSRCRFTDTTGRARRFPKASASTGGCRACWEA